MAGCVPADRRPTWRLFPLQRQQPHDGLAVVSQPDGYGLHIWLETDTRRQGVCRPRWLPDPARLFNGNGSHPFSSGLASREEFFAAVARRDVRRALRRELEALCLSRAPRSTWEWIEPPLNPSQVTVEKLADAGGEGSAHRSRNDPGAGGCAGAEAGQHRPPELRDQSRARLPA